MRLNCPNCFSSFRVPTGAITMEPRLVKCSACRHEWLATAHDLIPDDTQIVQQYQAAPTPQPQPPIQQPPAQQAPEQYGMEDNLGIGGDAPFPDLSAMANNHQSNIDNAIPNFDDSPATSQASETDLTNAFASADDAPPAIDDFDETMENDLLSSDMEMATEEVENFDNAPAPVARKKQSAPDTQEKKKDKKGIIILVSFIAVFFPLLGGFLLKKETIIEFFPTTQAIYDSIGMSPPILGEGLFISEPIVEKVYEGATYYYNISGEIENGTTGDLEVPLLKGVLQDKDGRDLYIWSFEAQNKTLKNNTKTFYTTRVESPPANTESLVIGFTYQAEAE